MPDERLVAMGWTTGGHLRIDDVVKQRTLVLVQFPDSVLTRLDKLTFVLGAIQAALNTVELTEEPKDADDE